MAVPSLASVTPVIVPMRELSIPFSALTATSLVAIPAASNVLDAGLHVLCSLNAEPQCLVLRLSRVAHSSRLAFEDAIALSLMPGM